MSNRDTDPRVTYRNILKQMAFPKIYAILGVIAGVVSIIYSAVLVHINATPVFQGELTATIARHPEYSYWLSMIAMGAFSVAALTIYARERND